PAAAHPPPAAHQCAPPPPPAGAPAPGRRPSYRDRPRAGISSMTPGLGTDGQVLLRLLSWYRTLRDGSDAKLSAVSDRLPPELVMREPCARANPSPPRPPLRPASDAREWPARSPPP